LFLGHARGSDCELQTQLVIAEGLGFGSEPLRRSASELCGEVSRMLVAIIKQAKDKLMGGPNPDAYSVLFSLPVPQKIRRQEPSPAATGID
jgi:hypothetical protein